MLSTFEYDGDGNRTRETYSSGGSNSVYYQNAVISYDALNRVTRFLDPKADITYKYDAAGNRRNVRSRYHDGVGGDEQVQDLWYRYDGQNRFVLTMGSLSAVGQAITLGSRGVAIGYDALGNRISASYGSDGHLETYTYTADGYLENTKINGVLRSSRTNDKMGRVTNYKEFGANGVTVTLNRDSVFDNDSRVVSEVTTSSGSVNSTTFDYRKWNGSAYSGADQGVLIHTGSVEGGITVNTTFYYEWWDEAKQTTIRKNASDPSNPNTGAWQPGVSDLLYDVNGHIAQMVDHQASGGTKTVEFTNDAYGQVLTRETWQNGALGPRQLFYYFDGKRIGDVSNDGPSPNLVDYAQQLAARDNARSTGLYRYGKPIASADFDQSYQPINSAYPASAATAYTVRSGDTLRSIAQSVWGDADMWYLIAESNGLSASSQLVAGQLLTIPNKVANFHNNTGTFRVYDPGNAIGDTLPTLPNEPAPPPARSHGGCGGIGKILVAVVAIAVTAFVAPQLLPGLQAAFGATGGAIAAGAAAGAAGSIVSQGFGIATGIQQNFSFKGVALAAIAGGVGGGVGQVMPGNLGGSTVLAGLARGLTASVLTQGIGIATGLQSSFSWSAVAAAGVAGGVTTGIGGSDSWGRAAANFAGGLGGAAAASLVSGQDFGDTLMASLPSIIASTVGNLVAGAVSGGGGAYDRSRGYGRDEVIDVLGNGGMLDVSGLANNSLINVPTIAGIATSSAAGAVLASAPTVRQLGFSIPGGAPAETSIAGNGDIVITGQRPMRPSSDNGFYWSASTTGVWDDIQQAIGENRDAGLSQIGSGGLGYITGAMQYAFSPITGALEISHAYYSGRSWVAPVDREVTGYALLGAGSVQGMGAKLAQLGRSAEVVASVNNAAESVAPKTLEGGVAHEAERLAQLGIPKNNVVWRPGQADFDSAAFKVIVGEPKFTPGGLPKGTIFDGTLGGNMEIKGGSSILDSSYQLRLQTYRSLKTNAPLTIETTRPVNPTFQSWLDRWGVSVVAPK
jgi:YD repeat-containing protein